MLATNCELSETQLYVLPSAIVIPDYRPFMKSGGSRQEEVIRMDFPKTLEDCHLLIRQLAEENAALRKSGDDFGHLAERLNLALREVRQSRSRPATGPGHRGFAWSAWDPGRPAGVRASAARSAGARATGYRECAAQRVTKP